MDKSVTRQAGGPHQRREYNAGFSLNLDRINLWVRHFSRAFREVASTAIAGQSLSSPLDGVRRHRANLFAPLLCGMRRNLKRYYGAGDLHFTTCSCYRRQPLLGTPRRRDLFLTVLEQVRRRYQFVVATGRSSLTLLRPRTSVPFPRLSAVCSSNEGE